MQATNGRHIHHVPFSTGTFKKVKEAGDINFNIFNLTQLTENISISTCNEYYKTLLLKHCTFFALSQKSSMPFTSTKHLNAD